MLVDNMPQQQPFSPSDQYTDISDIFHTELFAHNSSSSRESSPQSPSSHALQTPPQPPLPTAFPDILDPSVFTEPLGGSSTLNNPLFTFLDDEHLKITPSSDPFALSTMPAPSAAPYDFLGSFGLGVGLSGISGPTTGPELEMGLGSMDYDMSNSTESSSPETGINPQLVDTPSSGPALSEFGDDEHEQEEEETEKANERLTLTIAPIKVGGHGKARRGTVQTGGVVKKNGSASTSFASSSADKEPVSSSSTKRGGKGKAKAAKLPPVSEEPTAAEQSALATTSKSGRPLTLPEKLAQLKQASLVTTRASTPAAVKTTRRGSSAKAESEVDPDDADDLGDDDDLPANWRPPPEVFQKMTSKEKRQLRNKISARNFRVRRKEYISTLEGDIAERDRRLSSLTSELDVSQSENKVLRQEIAALKRALLTGRGTGDDSEAIMLNLPPPAPLPAQSAAEKLAAASSSSSSSTSAGLLTPNTQKDLPTSPRVGGKRAFWGGVGVGGFGGLGGGITPVHTALIQMPEFGVGLGLGGLGQFALTANNGEAVGQNVIAIDTIDEVDYQVPVAARVDQENINPSLNRADAPPQKTQMGGFEGFSDMNPFTMKTLDTYRMHLWTKMAQQHHAHQQQTRQKSQSQPQQPLSGLAGSLRPAFFGPSSKLNSASPPPYSHSPPPYSPATPGSLAALLAGKSLGSNEKERERERERQRQQVQSQHEAVVAALATQTLFKRLGSAFWDAFSGSSSAPNGLSHGRMDADKVRKVLEGKAVLRVVDVEAEVPQPRQQVPARLPTTSPSASSSHQNHCDNMSATCTWILEESMRSLTLGKK
ncbi:hypothetical protein HGRIS_000131 [Hohenbuehelia grisea]|uniref:BZIP domain-containing protein n=1 Tax=Hohenbuehelia grisea TaxID=104357 RepID=A0ABR3JQ52_9AGAR